MSTTLLSDPSALDTSPDAILRRLGFSRRGDVYRRGELRCQWDAEWLTLSRPAPKDEDPLALPGRPGLWKWVGEGAKGRLVFPLPFSLLRDDEERDPDEDDLPEEAGAVPLFEDCLLGAIATMAGEAPETWSAPSEEALASWTKGEGLTIQHRAVVRQIEVIRENRRFALRVTLLGEIPNELPEVRRNWLRALLVHTQNSWRLVRTALTDRNAAVLEVDLTGLPAAVTSSLFRAGLTSLRWVVGGVAETAEFLADPEAASEALELWPPPRRSATKPKPKKQHHG